METKQVHLNDIHIPIGKEEGMFRDRNIKEKSVQETAYSIQHKGLQQLFCCSKGNPDLSDKDQEIMDGSGRYFALLLIYLIAIGKHESINLSDNEVIDGTIEGTKYDGNITIQYRDVVLTFAERLAHQMTANNVNKKASHVENIDALVEIQQTHPGLGNPELAKMAGLTEQHLGRLFKTIKLPDECRKEIQNKELSLSNAVILSKLMKEDSETFESFHKDAKNMTENEFGPHVSSWQETQNKVRQDARKGKARVTEFKEKEKIRGKQEIMDKLHISLEEYTRMKEEHDIDPNTIDGALLAIKFEALQMIKWVCGLDEESIAIQKTAYDKKASIKEENKSKNQAEREKMKKLDDLYNLVEAGYVKQIPAAVKKDYTEYSKKRKEMEKEEKTA